MSNEEPVCLYSPILNSITTATYDQTQLWEHYDDEIFTMAEITVGIQLNLNNQTISFIINGCNEGIAYCNTDIIRKKGVSYNLAAQLFYNESSPYHPASSVTITDFRCYQPKLLDLLDAAIQLVTFKYQFYYENDN